MWLVGVSGREMCHTYYDDCAWAGGKDEVVSDVYLATEAGDMIIAARVGRFAEWSQCQWGVAIDVGWLRWCQVRSREVVGTRGSSRAKNRCSVIATEQKMGARREKDLQFRTSRLCEEVAPTVAPSAINEWEAAVPCDQH